MVMVMSIMRTVVNAAAFLVLHNRRHQLHFFPSFPWLANWRATAFRFEDGGD